MLAQRLQHLGNVNQFACGAVHCRHGAVHSVQRQFRKTITRCAAGVVPMQRIISGSSYVPRPRGRMKAQKRMQDSA